MTAFDARLRGARFIDWIGSGDISPARMKDALIALLIEAEDAGGERAASLPTADPTTVEALQSMIRELLEPDGDPTWAVGRAANITQVIIANFQIRLMDEVEADDDEETTLPGEVTFAEEKTR